MFPLTLAAAGCRDAPDSDAPDWLSADAQPVTLDLELDTARAVRRVIGERGGAMSVTGADGTRYRLRIPEGALRGMTPITLTPVTAVRGLPLAGGSIGAVHLEPDGLQLGRPATLTIVAAADVPAAEQVAFAYYGSGRDAHRYPLGLDRTGVEMQVTHFSGYGFARAAPDDPGRLALQRATSLEARLVARIAEALARDRDAGHTSMSDASLSVFWATMIEYYDAVLLPLMRTAERDDRMATCCLARYFAWERQIQLLGATGEGGPADGAVPPEELASRRAEGAASSRRILLNAVDQGIARAVRLCQEERDLTQVITMLRLAGAAEVLELPGSEEAAGARSRTEDVKEKVRRCLTFEVEFRSAFDNHAPANTYFLYELAAVVPLQDVLVMHRAEGADLGSAPLEYVRYQASGNPKEAFAGRGRSLFDIGSAQVSSAGTRPGGFIVRDLRWDYADVDRPGTNCAGADETMKRDSVVDMTIVFTIRAPTELTRHVPRIGGPFVMDSHAWLFHWTQSHGDAEVSLPGRRPSDDDEPEHTYVMKLEQTRPGEWRIEFDDPGTTELGYSLAERGHILLRHAPE